MPKVTVLRPLQDEVVNFPYGGPSGTPGQDFIRKSDLVHGAYYYGTCRNATCAKWDETTQLFTYKRIKFGSRFDEEINHPENDDGFDLFVPYFRCYPTENDLVGEDTKA
mgnify:CR=1 FL=1